MERFAYLSLVASAAAKCSLPIPPSLPPNKVNVLEEKMLKMRDGVRLHTVAVSPAPFQGGKQYPTVIDRSPYGMFNTELVADIFLLFGFAAVTQDMRGTCKSEGNFSLWHSDADDGADTIEWITQQPWSDGRVFQVGASADGIAGFVLARSHPAALKAQYLIVATAEARRTIFPGGAYRLALIEGWLKGTVKDQAAGLIAEVKMREAPSAWWDEVALKGAQFGKVVWPSVMWAGWYDIFLHGNLYAFDGYQKHSAPSVRGKHFLVVDPLGHCQDGAKYFPHHLIEGRSLLGLLLGLRLFRGEPEKVPEGVQAVTFYVMGATDAPAGVGNYWTSLADWPAATPTPLYFAAGRKLSWSPPPPGVNSSSSFTYDPSAPTPTIGGNNLEIACGPADQRKTEARSDVAVFTSDALEKPIALTGALEAVLHVSTASAINDTDFAVKLTDVYPDGTSRLIQDGIQRMRWRHGPMQRLPVPMKPHTVYKVNVSLWNTSYVFPAGHRIRVVVSSANSPRFKPNPNTGLPLAQEDGRMLVADNTVHHTHSQASVFILPVVSLEQLPKHDILGSVSRMIDDLATDTEQTMLGNSAEAVNATREALSRYLSSIGK
jgi:predicted acyl esterase